MIRYEVSGRNGYRAVDLYDGEACIQNVYIGRQKDAALVASIANEAVHRATEQALPLEERQKHGVLRGIEFVLDTLGEDEEPKTDQEVALNHTMIDGLIALRKLLQPSE